MISFCAIQFDELNYREGKLVIARWSQTSIGTRLELVPKFIIHPIYSGKEWGLRTGTEVMAVYRLLGGFSATLRLTRERFRFGDSFTTDTGSFNGKAVASTFQLGFAINID